MSVLTNRFNSDRVQHTRKLQGHRLRFNVHECLDQQLSIQTDTDTSSAGFHC